MQLPGLHQIESLHQKYAPTPEVLDLVFTHCKIVQEIAAQLMAKSGVSVDAELVNAGSLLHDIGVYALYDSRGQERSDLHYITHGIRGEEILASEGLPLALSRIASHHTGVGLTQLDISSQGLPLPNCDFLAETVEEDLIMYADKFHSKSNPPHFNSYDWYLVYVARFGKDKVEKFEELAQKFGIPDLQPLSQKYGHNIRT